VNISPVDSDLTRTYQAAFVSRDAVFVVGNGGRCWEYCWEQNKEA